MRFYVESLNFLSKRTSLFALFRLNFHWARLWRHNNERSRGACSHWLVYGFINSWSYLVNFISPIEVFLNKLVCFYKLFKFFRYLYSRIIQLNESYGCNLTLNYVAMNFQSFYFSFLHHLILLVLLNLCNYDVKITCQSLQLVFSNF